MHKQTPWTLDEEDTKESRVRKSNYIKERQSDLAISTARVQKLFELHKEKTFTIAQIAEALSLSEGTVSSIMNRLITLGDVSVVKMLRPHWAPLFQHIELAPSKVDFSYKKEDPIISIINVFKSNKDSVYSKDDLLKLLTCSESMLRRSLQILLLKGDIKLVGSSKGSARYQYKTGNLKGIEVYQDSDDRYTRFLDYINENNLKNKIDEIKMNLDNVKTRLFYSNKGLAIEYLKEDLDKINKKIENKGNKDDFISSLFKRQRIYSK